MGCLGDRSGDEAVVYSKSFYRVGALFRDNKSIGLRIQGNLSGSLACEFLGRLRNGQEAAAAADVEAEDVGRAACVDDEDEAACDGYADGHYSARRRLAAEHEAIVVDGE